MADRQFIDQLADVWSSISELGRDLNEADWDRPTDCPGWTVRDQLAHMVGTERALAGEATPPAAPPGLAHVHNPIGEMNEAWVASMRAQPGAEVLAAFDRITADRLATLRAMSDADLERDGPSPIGVVPYGVFMRVRVMDCWVHEQDMRRAVGRPGHLDGPAAEVALDRFTGSLGYVVGKRVGAPDGTTVVIEITGPLETARTIDVAGGRASVVEGRADREPVVAVSLSWDTFARLVAGRLAGDRALSEGMVEITGDKEMGERLVTNLATIP